MKDANNLNRDNKLQNELVKLVVPRSGKLTNPSNSQFQVANLIGAIEKICFPSLLLDEGWTRLPSLTAILNNVSGSKTFRIDRYHLDNSINPGKKKRVLKSTEFIIS